MKCVVMYGDSLRCAMAISKISCRDLGRMVGLSKSSISRYLNRQQVFISRTIVRKLARALNVKDETLMSLPDHPIIENCERTGYPDGKDPVFPICPICGRECDTVYRNSDREIVGCSECVTMDDAWEVNECFPERSE